MVTVKKDLEGSYDVAIIGGGPAGLTAGIYASRAGMRAVLVESMSVMGQAMMTDKVENYPGVRSVAGFDLLQVFREQADSFGLTRETATIDTVRSETRGEHELWCLEGDGKAFSALSVIIASGALPKKLNVPGEMEFLGRGVSYCATCDGAFFREKAIVVVGGGNAAIEEALYLTRFGKSVTVVHRRNRLRADKVLSERAMKDEKISFLWERTVKEIKGADKVEKIVLSDVNDGHIEETPCDGVFIFVGWSPNTGFLPEGITKHKGAIVVDEHAATSMRGVFAAGDCCSKEFKQIITACGDGANAAHSARIYVERVKGTAYD